MSRTLNDALCLAQKKSRKFIDDSPKKFDFRVNGGKPMPIFLNVFVDFQ